MKKAEKIEVAHELSEKLSKAKAVILAEYRGLKVSEITAIRREIKKNNGDIKVVKNRLARKAIAGSGWSVLDPYLKGPLAIAYSLQDPVVLSKVMSKAASDFEKLKLKAGCLDGKVLTLKEIDVLSKLPSREEMYAKVFGSMMAPAQGVVRTLQGVSQKLVIALKAIADKKQ